MEMASFCKFIFSVLVVLCLWSPLLSFGSSDLIQPECLRVPVSKFVSSVKSAIDNVHQVISTVSKYTHVSKDFRVTNAISDCLGLLDLSADELNWTLSVTQKRYGENSGNSKLSSDLRTWLGAVPANHDTCIEGFDGTNGDIKSLVARSINRITSLVTDILGMLSPIPDSESRGGTLIRNEAIPPWFNDKHMILQADRVIADLVVAADGTGDFTSVNDAIDEAPKHCSKPFVIYIKKGMYREYVEISKSKWNIMLIGDGMDATIISGNRNRKDGWSTYNSATFAVKGKGFIARDMTFENTAGPQKHQAVAFRSDSDLSVLYRCAIRGYQDTLYAHNLRQFYKNCIITGTVDFICGHGTVVFQNCQILVRKGLPYQKNTITAQGRRTWNESSGFSIQFCNISAEPDDLDSLNSTETYLGRPWKLYSETVIMQSYMSSIIHPRGWLEWEGNFALDTLFYGEYMNNGPGACLDRRVKWLGYHAITDSAVANNFTVAQLIVGNSWLPLVGITYTAGLDV